MEYYCPGGSFIGGIQNTFFVLPSLLHPQFYLIVFLYLLLFLFCYPWASICIVFGPHLFYPSMLTFFYAFFFPDDVPIYIGLAISQVRWIKCVYFIMCHSMHAERITLHRWGRWSIIIIQCMKARWVISAISTFRFWGFHVWWNQTVRNLLVYIATCVTAQ